MSIKPFIVFLIPLILLILSSIMMYYLIYIRKIFNHQYDKNGYDLLPLKYRLINLSLILPTLIIFIFSLTILIKTIFGLTFGELK